jgi:hypothetical protein
MSNGVFSVSEAEFMTFATTFNAGAAAHAEQTLNGFWA